MTAPILSYPRDEGRFVLDTDASDTGLGAVLSQEQDGQEKVLMYLSRSLKKEERGYCVTRKELLAIVYAVQQCKQYLLGREFLIRTDHGSLTWLMNFKEPQGQVARWIEVLSAYNYQIQHRPGRKHQNADALSRDPCGQCGKIDWKQAKIDAWNFEEPVRRTQRTRSSKTPNYDKEPEATTSKTSNQEKSSKTREARTESLRTWAKYTGPEIREMQTTEPWFETIQRVVTAGVEGINFMELSREEKVLYGMRRQLVFREGVLYRSWKTQQGAERLQLVTPRKIRREIFKLAHEAPTGGHLGVRKIVAKIKQRYFWPGIRTDVKQWILACDGCASRSIGKKEKMQMQKYRVGRPMERVAMDIMGPLPRTTQGNRYILVIGDYFTKWIEAFAIPNQEAKTVADKFAREFIARNGPPTEVHTDQGRNFEAALMKDVCRILGIHKTRTTPFRPQSNGFIEKFNRTLQQMLSLYVNERQTDWDRWVPLMMTAYRATPQETTGQTPNMLVFGREIELPVDLVAGIPPGEEGQDVTEYGAQLREDMEKVFDYVRKKSGREMNRQKKLYDRRKFNPEDKRYNTEDLVWVAVKGRRKGRAPKLQRKWRGPCVIVEQCTDVTYRVAENEDVERIIHFDLMKPYTGEKRPRWIARVRQRIREGAARDPVRHRDDDSDWNSTSSDDE